MTLEKDSLQLAKRALNEALVQKQMNQGFMEQLWPMVVERLQPILSELANNTKISKEEILTAFTNIKIEVPSIDTPIIPEIKIPEVKIPPPQVTVTVPEVKIPPIKVPKPEVTVNVPPIKVPESKPIEIPNNLEVTLRGVNTKNPLPVIFEGMTQLITTSGGGGGVRPKPVGFDLPVYDSLSLSETQTTDTYVFSKSGSRVAGLTITYVDDSRNTISTITRTS